MLLPFPPQNKQIYVCIYEYMSISMFEDSFQFNSKIQLNPTRRYNSTQFNPRRSAGVPPVLRAAMTNSAQRPSYIESSK